MAAHFLSPLTSDESIKTRKLKDPANNGREKVSWEDRKFAGKKQKKQTQMTSSFLPTAFIWLIQYTFFFRRQITWGKSLFFSYYN